MWNRPHATRRDIRWALNRGYLFYAIAFVVLVLGGLATGLPTPDHIAPLLVGLSATFGWVGAMLQIHAIAWNASNSEVDE